MKLGKYNLILSLIFSTILIITLIGCGQTGPANPSPLPTPSASSPSSSLQAKSQTKLVIDQIGNRVNIPLEVKSIACFSYQMVEVLFALGAKDKMTAGSVYGDVPWMDARLKALPNPYNSQTGINIEQLIKVNPDLVVMWGGSTKRDLEKVWEAGYPIICDWTMGQGATERAIQMMGKAISKEAESDKLLAYWAEKTKKIKNVVSTIPINQRTTVFYTGHGKLITCSKDTDEDWWLMESGAINTSRNASGLPWGTAAWWMELSVESVIGWNPDVIIISSKAGIDPEDILNDPQWKDIKAVKDKRVYRIPYGFHVWDRPCAERILGEMWLAQKLYPDKFADIDIRQETKGFFKTYFNVDLTEAEMDRVLAGQK